MRGLTNTLYYYYYYYSVIQHAQCWCRDENLNLSPESGWCQQGHSNMQPEIFFCQKEHHSNIFMDRPEVTRAWFVVKPEWGVSIILRLNQKEGSNWNLGDWKKPEEVKPPTAWQNRIGGNLGNRYKFCKYHWRTVGDCLSGFEVFEYAFEYACNVLIC